MSKELFVIFPDPLKSGEKLADWALLDAAAGIQSSGFADTYADIQSRLSELPKSISVIVVLPAEKVISTAVVMPMKGGRQMMQALPYMVEEGVAEDIEKMHLAPGVKSLSGRLPLALVRRDYLDTILEELSGLGIDPDAVYSAGQLPLPEPGTLKLVLNDKTALLCTENFFSTCETDNLSLMLDMLFEKSEDNIDKVLMVFNDTEGETALLADQLRTEIEATQALSVTFETIKSGLRDYLLQQLATNTGNRINLLQGAFGKGDQGQTLLRRWMPLAWAAVICLALQISFNVSMGYYFDYYSETGRSNMSNFYTHVFPGETPIKPRSQMEGKLLNASGVRGDSGFSRLMASAADAFKAMGDNDSLNIRQFRYEARRGQLTMELSAASIAQLDIYKQHISDSGLEAEILSASEEGNRINARLKIGGGI